MSVEATLPQVLWAKKEGTYGSDSVPVNTDAIRIQKGRVAGSPNFEHTAEDINSGTLGSVKGYVARKSNVLTPFSTYLQSPGTIYAGTGEPILGRLLEGCGLLMSGGAPATYCRYAPDSDISAHKSLSIYDIYKGQRRKHLGARGNFGLSYDTGESPLLTFNYKGLYEAAAALAWPSPHADYESVHPMVALSVEYTNLPVVQNVIHCDFEYGAEPKLIEDSANANGYSSVEILSRAVAGNLVMVWSPTLESTVEAAIDAETRQQLKIVFTMPGISGEHITFYFANLIYKSIELADKDGFITASMGWEGKEQSGDDEILVQFGTEYTP